MSNEELRAQAQTSAPQIKIAAGIWVTGMMIIAGFSQRNWETPLGFNWVKR